MENGWDQGLLFLNQSNVWLQPPGYVAQMYAANYQPVEVQSSVADPNNDLDVSAQCSQDGGKLVLKVVNLNNAPESATINLSAFMPTNPVAVVQVLLLNKVQSTPRRPRLDSPRPPPIGRTTTMAAAPPTCLPRTP